MDSPNGELTLEDLPIEWLAQCASGEDDDHELSLESLCESADLYVPHPNYNQDYASGQSALSVYNNNNEDDVGHLPHLDHSYDEFLYELSSPSASPAFSGHLEGDSHQLASCNYDSQLSPITCSFNKDTHQTPLPSIKVVRSNKSSKKRNRPHSSNLNSSDRKKQISSPMSVLDYPQDQPHCLDGSSSRFSTPFSSSQTRQALHDTPPKTTSPQKHSKKFSTSHCTPHLSKESKWAQQLLKACASAIATNNISRTQHLMWVLNDLASFTGDANQRLAACGLKALFSRVTGIVSLHPSLQNATDANSNAIAISHHRALLKFQDASPWHKCSYTIANGAIAEACEGHDTIHVVDIGVSQGTQWPTLIEALATRALGAPKLLKLTMVHDREVCGNFISRLEPFAKRLGLNLKLTSIVTPLESLTRRDLGLEEEEELIVCLQFRLHHLTQELTENDNHTSSKRDNFLRFIHSLNPNTFILSENDVDHCSPDFFARFQKAMEFHWSFLDSTSSSFQDQYSEERQIMEAEATIAFTNIVAFESSSRIERNETHRSWIARVQRMGFSSYLPGAQVLESAKSLLRKHSGDWNMLVEDGTMVLKWKGNPTSFCSIWKPFSATM